MMRTAIAILLVSLSILPGCESNRIKDRPIVFNEEREALSLAYLKERYGIEQEEPVIDPRMIVLHWTAIPDLDGSFAAFRDPKLPDWRPEIAGAGALNVSAHFLVDTDGSIYRLMSENIMARHTIGLNHCAIGVENVGPDKDNTLTEAQLDANVWLIRYLAGKYDIDYVIGHYEYTDFEDHPLWLEKDEGYRTQKTDPGEPFMQKVRQRIEDLNLKGAPSE